MVISLLSDGILPVLISKIDLYNRWLENLKNVSRWDGSATDLTFDKQIHQIFITRKNVL